MGKSALRCCEQIPNHRLLHSRDLFRRFHIESRYPLYPFSVIIDENVITEVSINRQPVNVLRITHVFLTTGLAVLVFQRTVHEFSYRKLLQGIYSRNCFIIHCSYIFFTLYGIPNALPSNKESRFQDVAKTLSAKHLLKRHC
jgi:hypothetical protein